MCESLDVFVKKKWMAKFCDKIRLVSSYTVIKYYKVLLYSPYKKNVLHLIRFPSGAIVALAYYEFTKVIFFINDKISSELCQYLNGVGCRLHRMSFQFT